MIVLMVYINMFYYFGNGPLKPQHYQEITDCKDIWWRNMLYIQNLWPAEGYRTVIGVI